MDAIEQKIKDLITFSYATPGTDENFRVARVIKNALIKHIVNQLIVLARERDTILGRIIKIPVANSFAIYVICNIRNDKVDVAWINYGKGLNDGLQDPGLTEFDYLPFDYAKSKVMDEEFFE